MYQILVAVHVVVCVTLIGVVLLQQGKGADTGAVFGGGGGGNSAMFGPRGSASFMSRLTAILATVFMVLSLVLAYLVRDNAGGSASLAEQAAQQQPADDGEVPAASSDVPAASDDEVPAATQPPAVEIPAPTEPAVAAPVGEPAPAQ